MGRSVHPLLLSDLAGLPRTCPDCDRIAPVDALWAQQTVQEWGQLGWRLDGERRRSNGNGHHNGTHASYGAGEHSAEGNGRPYDRAAILVAPARYRPSAGPLAAAPLSPDAAVLVSLRITPEFRGGGIGRRLVQASAALAVRRGYQALEAVGTRGPGTCCQLSVDWLRSVGFEITRDHPLTPRLRMDLGTTVRWRADLEAAWQRITSLVTPTPPPEPAGRLGRDAERYQH